jgi:hypothetical protein
MSETEALKKLSRNYKMRFSLLLVSLLVLVFSNIAIAQKASMAKQPQKASDLIPKSLVTRLLCSLCNTAGSTDLLVGVLPKRLPVQLSLPEQAKVIGSLITNYQENQKVIKILLDVPQSPDQVKTFFQNQFQADGWRQAQEKGFLNPGFVTSQEKEWINLTDTLQFCQDAKELSLSIAAKPAMSGLTHVYLGIGDKDSGFCQVSRLIGRQSKLPSIRLVPLPDTQVDGVSGGGNDDDYNSKVIIHSPLSRESLAAHYEAQLKQNRWARHAGSSDNPLFWSFWTFTDQQNRRWQGILSFVNSGVRSNQYNANFRIFKANELATYWNEPSISSDNSQEEMLPSTLATRFLDDFSSGLSRSTKREQPAKFFMGQLPVNLPTSIPLPTDTKIIGGLTREQSLSVILDVPQPVGLVQEFYQQKLLAEGWKRSRLMDFWDRSGFQGINPLGLMVFCKETKGSAFYVSTRPVGNYLTQVRLNLNSVEKTDLNSACNPKAESQEGMEMHNLLQQQMPPMPNLEVPAKTGVFIEDVTGAGGRATIQTQLSVEDLFKHYAAQMRQAGWVLSGSGQSGPMQLSAWFLKDKQGKIWDALLSFKRLEARPDWYAAVLSVNKVDEQEH